MPTRLSRIADGIMEAAWIAAVIVVPVFFNVYSSRIFEPDKITLLRTLALVILAAWTIKLFEEGGVQWRVLQPGRSRLKTLLQTPLIAPVLALVIVYILSTIFSVTPRVSFWGSYQRLQGTYTTFSYLVVFAAMLVNLRRRSQVDRLLGAAIVSSLPVSLYGVLQHFNLDPIPWGGDVTSRIASNMGNSIFVAAYLIMVFPITVMRIVDSFEALLKGRGGLGPNFARSTGYIFVLALQGIALYFSGSRGPWLGLFISVGFMWLGLSLIWRSRWMTISGVAVAAFAISFLILLNIPNGPLTRLRTLPAFGRLGSLLDSESRTGRVRTLIWQGAAELVQPHQPLQFPNGSKDGLNFLRPLIGYGPESMYVAYNPFYQPELTQVERRNASPDRSHNETWDSLVITGLLGLIVYLTLFGSVIYFALKWLGLVKGNRQRNLYLALYVLCGVVASVVFVVWKGLPYLGVALPFGMLVGVILYLILISLFGRFEPLEHPDARLRLYILLGLLAAVVAHYFEINFGIAIAATRTYFWVFSGLLLLVGVILPAHGEYQHADTLQAPSNESDEETLEAGIPQSVAAKANSEAHKENFKASQAKKKRRLTHTPSRLPERSWPEWIREALIAGIIVGVLLVTLGYDFLSNAGRGNNGVQVLWDSFTSLQKANGVVISFGVLAMILTTWVIGSITLVSEAVHLLESSTENSDRNWLKMIGVALGTAMLLALIFWLWHASNLFSISKVQANTFDLVMQQVGKSEGLLTSYYVFLFLLVFGLAIALPSSWPGQGVRSQAVSLAISAGLLLLAFTLGVYTNLKVIQADISLKTADLFSQSASWAVAINIYDRANSLAPSEDYYYLFLGRAYLEYAKTLTDATERDNLISQASADLHKAQEINPLNTDHTANLARLYSLWANVTTDPALKEQRVQQSSDYFSTAVTMSPQSARLWDEWAVLSFNLLNQPEEGYQRLAHSLTIDPRYDWTYGLIGDYYIRFKILEPNLQPDQKQLYLIQASDSYSTALKLVGTDTTNPFTYSYAVGLAGSEAQLHRLDTAISAYGYALKISPQSKDRWRIELYMARLYLEKGVMDRAKEYAQNALGDAPDEQKADINKLIAQLGG